MTTKHTNFTFSAACTWPGCKKYVRLPHAGRWLCGLHTRIAKLQADNEAKKVSAKQREIGEEA